MINYSLFRLVMSSIQLQTCIEFIQCFLVKQQILKKIEKILDIEYSF